MINSLKFSPIRYRSVNNIQSTRPVTTVSRRGGKISVARQKIDEKVSSYREDRQAKTDQADPYYDYQRQLMRKKREAIVHQPSVSKEKEETNTHKASTVVSPYQDINITRHGLGRTTGKYSLPYRLRSLRKQNPTLMKNLSDGDITTISEVVRPALKAIPVGHSLHYSHKRALIRHLREKGLSINDIRDVKKFLGLTSIK